MRKFAEAVPYISAIIGGFFTFRGDYIPATHSYAFALVMWKMQDIAKED